MVFAVTLDFTSLLKAMILHWNVRCSRRNGRLDAAMIWSPWWSFSFFLAPWRASVVPRRSEEGLGGLSSSSRSQGLWSRLRIIETFKKGPRLGIWIENLGLGAWIEGSRLKAWRWMRRMNKRKNPIVFLRAFSLPTNKHLPLAFKKPCTFYKLIIHPASDSSHIAVGKISTYQEKSFVYLPRIPQLCSRDRAWFSYRAFFILVEHPLL